MNKRKMALTITLLMLFLLLVVIPSSLFAQSYGSWQKQQKGDTQENRLLNKVKDNPGDISGYIRLGNYYKDKAQYDLAVTYFDKAMTVDPKDLSAYKSCSEAYLKAGRLNDAIAIMEKADSVLPNDYDVIIALAPLYSIKKDYNKVVDIYKKGIEANKEKRALLRVKLAEFYEKNEEYDEAADEYEMIANERPDLAHFKEKADVIRKKERLPKKPSVVGEKSLSDLKVVYLDYQTKPHPNMYPSEMKKEQIEKREEKITSKLKEIGLDVTDDAKKADAVLKWSVLNTVDVILFGWEAEKMIAEFILPDNDFTIARFTAASQVNVTQFAELEDSIIKQIKYDIDNKISKVRIMSNGKPEKVSRHVYVVQNNRVIYNGEEKPSDELWKNPNISINDLKIEYNKESANSIAVLVYNTNDIDPFSNSGWLANRKRSTLERITKYGFDIMQATPKDKLLETYGYLMRFDTENKKMRVFFNTGLDYSSILQFTTDKNLGKTQHQTNHFFPRELSYPLSEKVVEYFKIKGYKVLNLTPARMEFNKMKPDALQEEVKNRFGIDKVFVMPYSAYTKWVHVESPGVVSGASGSINTYIGLRLCDAAYIFEYGKKDVPFQFVQDIQPISSEGANLAMAKLNFYSWEKDPTDKITALKDGVIDDEWIIEKTMLEFFCEFDLDSPKAT